MKKLSIFLVFVIFIQTVFLIISASYINDFTDENIYVSSTKAYIRMQENGNIYYLVNSTESEFTDEIALRIDNIDSREPYICSSVVEINDNESYFAKLINYVLNFQKTPITGYQNENEVLFFTVEEYSEIYAKENITLPEINIGNIESITVVDYADENNILSYEDSKDIENILRNPDAFFKEIERKYEKHYSCYIYYCNSSLIEEISVDYLNELREENILLV